MTTYLMTIDEAAEEYGVPRSTITSRLQAERMPSFRAGGHVYVRAEDMEEFKEKSALSRRGPHFAAVLEGHGEGMIDYAIAKKLGLSRERIRQIRNKLGLPLNPRTPRLPKTFTPGPKTLLEVFSGNDN
jgi:excisionase family DNA binding protein